MNSTPSTKDIFKIIQSVFTLVEVIENQKWGDGGQEVVCAVIRGRKQIKFFNINWIWMW